MTCAGCSNHDANNERSCVMRCLLAQIKKRFLEWADSEPGVDVSPDVDLFHEFKEVRV